MRLVDDWRKSLAGGGNSKCKGSKAGGWKMSKWASQAEEEWTRGENWSRWGGRGNRGRVMHIHPAIRCKDFSTGSKWNEEPLGILRKGVTWCGCMIAGSLLQCTDSCGGEGRAGRPLGLLPQCQRGMTGTWQRRLREAMGCYMCSEAGTTRICWWLNVRSQGYFLWRILGSLT